MNDYRSNQKSIRISDDVLYFIEKFEGDNFNDKLNNCIRFFISEEDAKMKKIKQLDDYIYKKQQHIFSLQQLEIFKTRFDNILSVYDSEITKYNSNFK